MAVLVIFTMGLAIWHFAVLYPDRYLGGMVGALFAAIIGSFVTGLIFQFAVGNGLYDANMATVIMSVPGGVIGMYISYQLGIRKEAKQTPA